MIVTEDSNAMKTNYDKLKQMIPTDLLDTVSTIVDEQTNNTTERARTGYKRKLTRLLCDKEQRQSKPDNNWISNISSRSLVKSETRVLANGLNTQ